MAITILHWNARSIFKKLPELKQYLAGLTMRPDVICIQETHLTPKYHPVFPNYTILRQDRPPVKGKGGGYWFASNHLSSSQKFNCLGRALVWKSSGSPWVGMRSSMSIIHPLTAFKRKILFFSQDLEKLFCVATLTLTTVCGAVSVQIITAMFYSLFSKLRTLSF